MSKIRIITFIIASAFLFACNNATRPPAESMAASPEELNKKVTELIQASLTYALENNGRIDDSIQLGDLNAVKLIYEKNQFSSVWSSEEKWSTMGDSLLSLVNNAKLYGLFPEDYHATALDSLNRKFINDSLFKSERTNAASWAKAELMLTDAFAHIIRDVKLGRLPQDSISLRKDSVLPDEFYFQKLRLWQRNHALSLILESLEPHHPGYKSLKAAIPSFLKHTSDKEFTVVPSPKQRTADFNKLLQQRLYEGGYLAYDSVMADSVVLADAIKKFQDDNGITVDGKVGEETVRLMNTSDKDKFVRIAITLDKYKMLPEEMPSRYVWVNLPGYYLKFYENDTLQLTSKIICGKPNTRTPLLTSGISELITYPQWTIPESIIKKEILPGIKRDSAYLSKKGYSLIDSKGDEVDPNTVEWAKYKNGIPYKVVQGSGDDNALGILKFNFPNKYAVYLHDTNQRYLFGQTKRSLSHGCVRVQEWQKLAYSIVRYDNNELYESPSPTEDSMTHWLQKKEKHRIGVRNKLPVYIRYITCDGVGDKVVFYDDIYGEDKYIRENYFKGK
jgi:L,D-transpeptidase YcbB